MLSSSEEGKRKSKSRKKLAKRKRILKKRVVPSPNLVIIEGKSFHASTDNEVEENIPNDFILVTRGMRWKCIMCGFCCNGNWQINFTWKEYDRLKDVLPIETLALHELTGASHPYLRITGSCQAYDKENNKCSIYDIKSYTCSAFPFLLNHERDLHICKSCEGFGHGPPIDIDEKITELIELKRVAGMNLLPYTPSTKKEKKTPKDSI